MDPLINLVTQVQRDLVDNTQRSSELMRAQQDKQARVKKSRSSGVDFSELSADCNEMGQDLLGSMDPDLSGRGGAADAFRDCWEDLLGEEQDSDPEDQQEQELEEELADQDDDPGDPELPAHVGLADADLEELQDGRWQPFEEDEEPSAEAAPEPDVEQADAPERAPSADRVPGQPEQAPSEERSGSWSSLLEHGEGFLVAGEAVEVEPAFDELHHGPPEIDPALASLAAGLIAGETEGPAGVRLQSLLARFGAGVLRLCLAHRVRVVLLPAGAPVSSHPEVAEAVAQERPVGAVYLPGPRCCVVEQQCLLKAPRHFHPVLFYFALAFDHALGDGGFASLGSPAVRANFQACSDGLQGHQFCDPLAETSPCYYFAQAVEAYLQESDCSEPLWTREDLYDFDRSMYAYVEYLFRRQNR